VNGSVSRLISSQRFGRPDDAKMTIICRETNRTKHDFDGCKSGKYWLVSFGKTR